MAEKMVCQNGCNASFYTTAHVVQDWEVDSKGNFIKSINDCSEVAHKPDINNIWTCSKCGGEGIWTEVPDEQGQKTVAGTRLQEQSADERPMTYRATFYLTLMPGREITEISKSLSNAIGDEIAQEFPEIDCATSCEFEREV